MERRPGRNTRPAYTRRRRIWYGYGQQTEVEKSEFGCFLHDLPHVFADVFLPSIPVLLYVLVTADSGSVGVIDAMFVAWMTMTVVATAIRVGWIDPLATDTLGWVSISPWLVGLRIGYYNLTLVIAAYGGVFLAASVAYPPAVIGIAAVVALTATMAFPRLGEVVARRTVHSTANTP